MHAYMMMMLQSMMYWFFHWPTAKKKKRWWTLSCGQFFRWDVTIKKHDRIYRFIVLSPVTSQTRSFFASSYKYKHRSKMNIFRNKWHSHSCFTHNTWTLKFGANILNQPQQQIARETLTVFGTGKRRKINYKKNSYITATRQRRYSNLFWQMKELTDASGFIRTTEVESVRVPIEQHGHPKSLMPVHPFLYERCVLSRMVRVCVAWTQRTPSSNERLKKTHKNRSIDRSIFWARMFLPFRCRTFSVL